MAKLTIPQHKAMRICYDSVEWSNTDVDLHVALNWWPQNSLRIMRTLAKKGLIEMEPYGPAYLTSAGLAYCREHFGKEAQNAQ